MADTIRKVDYFYTVVSNTPGQAATILSGLATEGVELLALSGFPSGRRAQVDLVPVDSAQLKRAAKKLGMTLSPRKTGFLVQGEDRLGAMTAIVEALAPAKINITAAVAVSAGEGRFGAVFWVKPESVARAARVLGAK